VGFDIRDSLKGPQARLNQTLTSTTQEQGAVQVGVAFKNGHHKGKALEGRELEHRGDFSRYPLCATAVRKLRRFPGCWIKDLARALGSGSDGSNRFLDHHSTRPRPRPFPEDLIAAGAIVQARHEALLSFLRICREYKRKKVQILHIFSEYPAEVGARCV